MEAETLGDTRSNAKALVDALADSQAEVEAETLDDTLIDSQALVKTLPDLPKQWSTRWVTHKQRCRQRR